jgi:hypothetical protein
LQHVLGDTATVYLGDLDARVAKGEPVISVMRRVLLAALGTQEREEIGISAAALTGLEPSALSLGHGPVVPQPQEAMLAAVRRAGGSATGCAQPGSAT